MFTTTMLSILLELQPASLDPPDQKPFEPVRTEVTADDQGMEILAYGPDGELVGALVATPNSNRVRIEADFDDGYATIELTPDEADQSVLRTDLEQNAAAGRVAQMLSLAFAATPPGPLEASKNECMWAFASIATLCGSAALFPIPVGVFELGGCLFGLGAALCECGQYLPLNICP